MNLDVFNLIGLSTAATAGSVVIGGVVAREQRQKKDRTYVQWYEIQIGESEPLKEAVISAFINVLSHIGRNGLKRKIFGPMGFRFYFIGQNKSVKMYVAVPIERKIQMKQSIESLFPNVVCTEAEASPLENVVTLSGYSAALKSKKDRAPFQPYSSNQIVPVIDQVLGFLKAAEEPSVIEITVYGVSPKKIRQKESDMPLVDLDIDSSYYVEKGLFDFGQEFLGRYNIFDSPSKNSSKAVLQPTKEIKKVKDIRESLSQRAFEVGIILYAQGANAKGRVNTIASAFSGMNLINSFKVVKKGKKMINHMHTGVVPDSHRILMATSELANILQIPHSGFSSWPLMKEGKKHEAPKALFQDIGLRIGLSNSPSTEGQKMRLGIEALLSHGFIEAQPGAGKTNLLGNMVVDLMEQQLIEMKGRYIPKTPREGVPGFTVFDPHGDWAEKLLTYLPSDLYDRTHYVKLSERDFPRAFNVYDNISSNVETTADVFVKSLTDLYPATNAVRMQNFLKNGVVTLLKSGMPVTPLHIPLIYTNKAFRNEVLAKIRKKDPFQMEFWNGSFKAEEGNIDKVMGPIWNRLSDLSTFDAMRNMFGQVNSFINIRSMMDKGKNLIIDASGIGPDNMRLTAAWFLFAYHFAAQSRVEIPEKERRGHVYFGDEVHGYLSQVVANIIDEDRKFGLGVWLSTQFADQIENKRLLGSILKNIGNHMSLRSPKENAVDVAKRIGVKAEDIMNLPDNHGYALCLVQEGFSKSNSLVSFYNPYLENGPYDPKPFRDFSNHRDGRPKEDVESEMKKLYRINNKQELIHG